MERKKLAWIVEALAHRVRDFPGPAVAELFETLDKIEKKYDLLEPLSEEDRVAIERGRADIEAGRFVTHEELKAQFADLAQDYDADAAGKEDFLDAIGRVQKLPGEEQRNIADIVLAVLGEHRFDIPPHPRKKK